MDSNSKLMRQLSDKGRALFLDAIGTPVLTSNGSASSINDNFSLTKGNETSSKSLSSSTATAGTGTGAVSASAYTSGSYAGASSPPSPGRTHYSPQLRAHQSAGVYGYVPGAASLVGESPALKAYMKSTSLSSYDNSGFTSLDAVDPSPLVTSTVIVRWKVPRVAKHGSMAFEVVCNELNYRQYKQQEAMSTSQKTARKSRNQYIQPHDVLADQDSEIFIYLDARRGIHASHSDIQLATQALLHSDTTTFSLSNEEILEQVLKNGEVVQ